MAKDPSHINPELPEKGQRLLTADAYVEGILSGDRYMLSRAITIVESRAEKYRKVAIEILDRCMPRAGNSIRVGITGVPGVGKSSFIEKLGLHVIEKGKRLAVLAIDPSSRISKGAILGDKTRMEKLSAHASAFIRPSATGHSLGGVARKTRESIILCEAAGFDVVFVETVGVGQSETAVSHMVDFFLLLVLAGAGDELQGIKRGIMELADAIVINKADGKNLENAEKARMAYLRALQLFPPKESGWTPPVMTASALSGLHLPQLWDAVEAYRKHTRENKYWEARRKEQLRQWLHESFEDLIYQRLHDDEALNRQMKQLENEVIQARLSAAGAASLLFKSWLEGLHGKG